MNKLQRSLKCLLVIACTAAATMLHAQARLDTGWSVGGGALSSAQWLDSTRYFEAGNDYVIAADGDSNARDVDLLILDSRGRVIVKDESSSQRAQVRFTPRNSGIYTIRLKMAEARGRALGFYFVFRIDGGGWHVPQRDISAAVGRLTALTTRAGLVNFQLERFYGCIMRPGERQAMSFSGLTLGNYSIMAVGDDFARDLDLIAHSNGNLLDYDIEVDPIPVTMFRAEGQVETVLTYESGSGPALVLMALYHEGAPRGSFRRL